MVQMCHLINYSFINGIEMMLMQVSIITHPIKTEKGIREYADEIL